MVRFAFAQVGTVQPAPSHTISEYVPLGRLRPVIQAALRSSYAVGYRYRALDWVSTSLALSSSRSRFPSKKPLRRSKF